VDAHGCNVSKRVVKRYPVSVCLRRPSQHSPIDLFTKNISIYFNTYNDGWSDVVVEYRTRNREVAGSTHTRSTASNLEQVANLLCAQVNSASYPQQDGK